MANNSSTPEGMNMRVQLKVQMLDVPVEDPDGSKAMARAAELGRWDQVFRMVQNGANVRSASSEGRSAMLIAAGRGYWDTVKWMVIEGADICSMDYEGRNALVIAGQQGQWKVVKWLVEKGSDNRSLDVRNVGQTAVEVAAGHGYWDMVKWLVNYAFDVCNTRYGVRTAVVIAGQSGHWDMVKWLVNRGADYVHAEKYGEGTAVVIAAENGQWDKIKMMVKSGVDIRSVHTGLKVAASIAIENGRMDMTEWLLDNMPHCDASDDTCKFQLHYAVNYDHFDIMKLLVHKGAYERGEMLDEFTKKGHLTAAKWISSYTTPTFSCNSKSKELVVKGYYVRLQDVDVAIKKCTNIKILEVHALNTLFLDQDLVKSNLQAVIIAPIWNVVGTRKITFSSNSGSPSLLAIGNFVNSQDLTILVNNQKGLPNMQIAGSSQLIPLDVINLGCNSKPYRVVNSYQAYLRERSVDRELKQELIALSRRLTLSPKVGALYGTYGLIDALSGMENQFHELHDTIDFAPFYQILLQGISKYAEHPISTEKSHEYRKALSYLYTATLSKASELNYRSDGSLIIDISEFLRVAIEDIVKLQDISDKFAMKQQIERRNAGYKTEIDNKIKEAMQFTAKITAEIDAINDQIEREITKLVEEVREMVKRAEKEKEELEKKREELKRMRALGVLFGVLKGLSVVLGFLGPIGAVAGGILGVATGIAESFTMRNRQSGGPVEAVPAGVKNLLETAENGVNYVMKRNLQAFNEQLSQLSNEASKYPDQLGDTSSVVTDIQSNLSNDEADVDELQSQLDTELARKKQELEYRQTEADRKTQGALKTIQYAHKALHVAQVSTDIYLKYQHDSDQIEQVEQAIKHVDAKIAGLKVYEQKIYDFMGPTLKNMRSDLKQLEGHLENKTLVALDFTKWQVQTAIEDMRIEMHKFTEGFETQSTLTRQIQKLNEAMTTLINVYDRIQNYGEQKRLADYIAEIALSGHVTVYNNELGDAITKLDIMIRSNVVLGHYREAVTAYKQFVFPFANFYLDQFNLPAHIKVEDSMQDLVSNAEYELGQLKSKISASNIYIDPRHHPYVCTGGFYDHHKFTDPFFVWKSDEYENEITELLTGKEVTLNADILNVNKSAVKFNMVEISFLSSNETLLGEVQSKLKDLRVQVSMTHMGHSYYRCDDQVYVMSGDSQTIKYTYEKFNNGTPIVTNNVYWKLKDGDYLLSPYAMWTMKLVTGSDLSEMEQYGHQVDLALEGTGQYVNNGYECGNLDQFYTVYNTPEVKNDEQINRRSRDILEIDDVSYSVSNSGSSISSAINDVVNWITPSLHYINYLNPVRQIRSWFSGEAPEMGGFNSLSTTMQFHANETLALVDLVIRKITKRKPYVAMEDSVSLLEAQADVLNVVDSFEVILEELSVENQISLDEMQFDPVTLQTQLMKEVINGDILQLRHVLYNCLDNSSVAMMRHPELKDFLKVKIDDCYM